MWVVVAIAMSFALVACGGGTVRASRASNAPAAGRVARRVVAIVTLAPHAASVAIPSSFLGISGEYWTVPVWAGHLTLLERTFGMLGGDGPVRLRIGGSSADQVVWAPSRELPEWAYELNGPWLSEVSRIVHTTHVKLILDLNLVTATPALAARWAKTALAKLPQGSITAFEIGNEPDIYSRRAWQQQTAGPGAPPLPARITASSYARSFASYARALSRVAPGVPLLAPALADPQKSYGWVTKLLQAPHPDLRGITAHRYPYSACAARGAPTYPTIARVLSENATAGMGRTALKVEHISDRAGLPLWLTEINSVTCGGKPGVSDTFATALWAPDALMELVQSGVESASVHVRANAINMAFSLTTKGMIAHPLFYGMVLFERTLGPGARLIPLHLAAAATRHLKAWAVRLSGGLVHILLLNKGSRPAGFLMNLPLTGVASVERLEAPSVSSTRGVSFAGQHIDTQGVWTGARHVTTLPGTAAGYHIILPRYSAALITARLRPGP